MFRSSSVTLRFSVSDLKPFPHFMEGKPNIQGRTALSSLDLPFELQPCFIQMPPGTLLAQPHILKMFLLNMTSWASPSLLSLPKLLLPCHWKPRESPLTLPSLSFSTSGPWPDPINSTCTVCCASAPYCRLYCHLPSPTPSHLSQGLPEQLSFSPPSSRSPRAR